MKRLPWVVAALAAALLGHTGFARAKVTIVFSAAAVFRKAVRQSGGTRPLAVVAERWHDDQSHYLALYPDTIVHGVVSTHSASTGNVGVLSQTPIRATTGTVLTYRALEAIQRFSGWNPVHTVLGRGTRSKVVKVVHLPTGESFAAHHNQFRAPGNGIILGARGPDKVSRGSVSW
jgi:hypothetical protein